MITIQQPADNSRTNQQAIEIKGTLSEEGDVEVKLNSESKGYADKVDLTFSKVLLLKEGINEIIIDAKDIAGNNIQSIKRTITYDYKAPNLSITEPSQDITTQDKTVKIKGSYLDDYSDASKITITVEVDGVPVTGVVVSAQDKTFEYTLQMTQSKQYKIKVTARDEVSNESTVERNILFKPKSGDLNKDGKVDIADAVLALRVAVGLEQQTAEMLQEGDVAPLETGLPKPDGKITTGDAIVILRKIVGKVSW